MNCDRKLGGGFFLRLANSAIRQRSGQQTARDTGENCLAMDDLLIVLSCQSLARLSSESSPDGDVDLHDDYQANVMARIFSKTVDIY
jgi:hypothetical protein